jgi:hypothetical protein
VATKSEGVCRFCLQSFSGAGMSKHLATCKTKKEKDAPEASAAKGKSAVYHLKITGYSYFHDGPYWLHIEMNDTAKLYDLEQFLRGIWLECCGHLSEFTIDGVRYSDSPADDFFEFEDFESESMDAPLKKLFGPDVEFEYVYDFGSSTELSGQVMAIRPGKMKGELVRILARNNPYQFECSSCGKNASDYCLECDAFYCGKCLQKHNCGEEMALPVVNSPRMGVCGYVGELDEDEFM